MPTAVRLSLTLLFVLTSTQLYARGLLVSPTQVGLSGKAGSAVTASVFVASSRAEKNQIRVTTRDFMRDERGAIRVLATPSPRSCRDWLEIDQAAFETPESGRIEIHITARIPKEAKGSYWALAEFESVPPPRSASQGTGLRIIPAIVIPVIVTAQGTEEFNVLIGEFDARQPAGKDYVECTSVVENKGNAAVMISGAFTLERAGSDAEEVGLQNIEPITSLPGTRMKIRGRLPWKGSAASLQAHAYLRYGPRPEDSAEAASAIVDETPSGETRPHSPSERMVAPPKPGS